MAKGVPRLFSLDFPSARWDSLHCVFLAYKLRISPLPVCEHLVSTTSEGCPYNIRTDMQIVFPDPLMTNTRSGLTTWTTPTVAAQHQKKIPQGMISNPPFQLQYSLPPNMHTPIHEASICKVMSDPPVVEPSGSATGNNSKSPNDPSSSDTTPMPSMPSSNNAALQGNAPNPGGKDPNPDNDPIPSDHISFRSGCSWCSNGRPQTHWTASSSNEQTHWFCNPGQAGNCKISYILLLVDIYAQHIYLCFI